MAAFVDAREQGSDERVGRGRGFVGVANAQATAKVDVGDGNALALERLGQVEHTVERSQVGRHLGDLRADVAVDADDVNAGQAGSVAVGGERPLIGNAELAVFEAGRDVGVGLGVDVGIHAQADRRTPAQGQGHFGEQVEFGLAFDVEAVHTDFERAPHLEPRLAQAGEHHARGRDARGDHAFEFAARDDVEAATGVGEGLQHGQAGIGLHCIAQQVFATGQRLLVGGECRQHGALRVSVEGRAELRGEQVGRTVFDEQLPAPKGHEGGARQRHGVAPEAAAAGGGEAAGTGR